MKDCMTPVQTWNSSLKQCEQNHKCCEFKDNFHSESDPKIQCAYTMILFFGVCFGWLLLKTISCQLFELL